MSQTNNTQVKTVLQMLKENRALFAALRAELKALNAMRKEEIAAEKMAKKLHSDAVAAKKATSAETKEAKRAATIAKLEARLQKEMSKNIVTGTKANANAKKPSKVTVTKS